ncbi:MAG: PAS domain S-box protein [Chloroflexales bacterium]
MGRGAFDHELRFLSMDATLAMLFGLPSADYLGQPLSIVLPTLAPIIAPLLRHVLTSGEPILDVDVRGALPDGRPCRWLASYYPVCTRTGSVIAVECAVHALDQRAPFTALTATQAALHQATNQLTFHATILANLNDAVVAIDMDQRITYWGPGAERLYGVAADAVRNRPIIDIIRYQWIEPVDAQALRQTMERGGVWRGELRTIHQRGTVLSIAVSISVLTSALGQRVGYLGVIRDMTDYRRAEMALRASEERFRMVHERSLDGITIMRNLRGADGTIVDFTCVYLNPVAERLIRQPLALIQGRRMTEILPGVVTNGLLERYCQVATDGEPQTFEQHYDTDGINAWYRNMVIRLDDGLAISFSDITAQKQIEAALRTSEERFRQFAAAVSDIFWISDPAEHKLLYINPAYEQIMGRSCAALYANAMEWIEAIHPDDRVRVASAFFERIDAGTSYDEEFRIVRPDGSVRWLRDRGFPIWDAAGTLYRAARITEDITQRKEHAVQIEFLVQVLDAVQHAVIATDPDGIILYWNRSAEELYGWTSAETQGRNVLELMVGGPDRDQAAEILAALRDGNSWSGEFPVYRRDGSRLDVLVTGSPIYDPQGSLIGNVGSSIDITRRKRADLEQAQLLACTTALAKALTPAQVATAIFENVHEMFAAQGGSVVVLSEDGQILELLGTKGYSAEASERIRQMPVGTPNPLADVIRSGSPVWVESPAEIAARYPIVYEIQPEMCAGATLPLSIQQRMIGALGISFSVPRTFTAEDRVYLQLIAHECAQALKRAWLYESERRAHLEAESAVHTRDELLSMVSHDLRNPLTVILGQAQLMTKLAQGLGEPGQRLIGKLAMIRDMVGQMDGQLEELLDIARLHAGQMLALNLQSLDLVALIQDVARTTQAVSVHHQISLAVSGFAILCHGDRRRLARVFQNLFSNAIAYSPEGGPISVEITRVTDAAGRWGVVSVQDVGLGIPAADLPRIFERFYRGANVTGRIRGTGLGLASARQIVEQHGGHIHVASDEGRGSTFTVHLPCLVIDEPAPLLLAAAEPGGAGLDATDQ